MSTSAGASAPNNPSLPVGNPITGQNVTSYPNNHVFTNQKLAQSLDIDCVNGFRWPKDVEMWLTVRKDLLGR